MLFLSNDVLLFRFPAVHPQANLAVSFQRTFRVPEDGGTYPKPRALGRFPLRLVDDFPRKTPPAWKEHGGIMLPIYRSEALWINLEPGSTVFSGTPYPFAVKVAAGKINAVTGGPWREDLNAAEQDYLVHPGQECIDGFLGPDGRARQFSAEFLGRGATREEQVTGKARYGGMQIAVWPMKRESYEEKIIPDRKRSRVAEPSAAFAADMGLARGGNIHQEVLADPFGPEVWDTENKLRCFIHLCDAWLWEHMTGEAPPDVPPKPAEYQAEGLPWLPVEYEEPITDSPEPPPGSSIH
ncbi:MAG: hypothetical protein AB1921_17365 [Thermodesulfobacteriota bacterium]